MDGLECSEINLRYVKDNLLRVDAEYYQKDSLILETVLESMAGKTISAHNGKTDCSAFILLSLGITVMIETTSHSCE